MKIQWKNLKEDLNPMDEFVYLQELQARNLGLPKAFSHKPKKPADEKPPQGKLVKEAAAPAKARNLNGARNLSAIRKMHYASQTSSIMMEQENRSRAKCLQSQKELRRQLSSTRSK